MAPDDAQGSVQDQGERAGPHRPQQRRAGMTAADESCCGSPAGQHERNERRDQAEHGRSDGLGPDRPLALAFDHRGDPEDAWGARRKQPDELPLHGGHVTVAAGQPQAGPEVGRTAARHLPGQRRGGQNPVDPVDIVLDDLVGEYANTGDGEPDPVQRLPGHRVEARVGGLLPRIEVEVERLPRRGGRSGGPVCSLITISPGPGVGTPAFGDDDAVLVEVEAVQRADQLHLLVERGVDSGEPGRQGPQAVEGYIRLGRRAPAAAVRSARTVPAL